MLKRLLVAVFVLGLLLAFSSTAFSDETMGNARKAITTKHAKPAPPTYNTHPAKLGSVYPWNQVAPANHRALSVIHDAPGSEVIQAPASPDTTTCGNFDYQAIFAPGYYSYIMQAGDWTDRVANSFDVPENYHTTVTAIRVRTYEVKGNPSITVQLHEDNLGLPGAVVYSQTFGPFAPLAYPGHTKVLTLSTPQTFTSGSYWVSVGQTGLPTDSVGIGIMRYPDSTTLDRGRYSLDGTTFMTFQGAGFTLNWDARIAIARCNNWSQCYSKVIDPRGMYGVALPDNTFPDGSNFIGIGQRFVAAGPETLKAVRVLVVDEVAFGLPGHLLYGPTSTNGFVAKLWTDSSGSIDQSTGSILLGSVPGGLANIFPTTDNNGAAAPLYRDTITIPVPGMPVLIGPYHITVEPTSPNPADGSPIFRFGIDATFGGGSILFTPPGITDWHLAALDPGFCPYETLLPPYNGSFDIRPYLCKDEFSICKTAVLYDFSAMYIWTMDGINNREFAQKVKGNPVNRVEKLRFQVDYSGPGTVGLTAKIFAATLSGPGALLYSQAVASPTFYPGWTEVVIPGGVQVLGDFYIGFSGIYTSPLDTLYALSEDEFHGGPHAEVNGGGQIYSGGVWYDITDALGYSDNFLMEADLCQIPTTERPCVTENDWPTFQHDFGRTGASGTAVGSDAYCDLTLNWSRIKPNGYGINLNGPIIWNNYVICAFSGSTAGEGGYEVLNLQTGATVYSFTDAAWPPTETVIGGNLRCTPTVATVDIDGTVGVNLKPVLFLAGGTAGSVSAFDLSAGFPPTKLWTYNNSGNMGQTRYGNLIVLNISGTDVVFVAADDNKVYAIDVATGLSYWAAPFALGYSSQKGGATDGTDLFYSLFNSAGNGKITAIKASNGTLAWSFTGLQATSLFTGVTAETFEAGVSTADGEVYANSRVLDGTATVANYRRGVFYRLNAGTGVMLSATAGERARTTTPTIDAQKVIVPNLPAVTGASATGGQVLAFSRTDGSFEYSTSSFFSAQNGGQMGYFVEGLLTCEPDSADFYFVFNIAGYLSCFNADNGNEVFHRRIDHAGSNQGGMGAIGKDALGDVHLVYVDAYGGIYDQTKQSPRARLALLAGSGVIAVPFGSPVDTIVEFPNMYTNTGCVNLVVSLTANTTSNGTTVPAPSMSTINSRLNQNASSLANMLSSDQSGDIKRLGRDLFTGSADEIVSFADVRETYNRSAAAVPAFLNQNGGSYVGDVFDPALGNLTLAPGATAGIRVHANGPLVSRGPNSFYCAFDSINDPDYYLDNTARRPELFLSLVGGCLLDTATLHFGAGGVNLRHVTNSSMLGKADWGPPDVPTPGGYYGFKIDGMIDISFAGTVAYGVSQRRLAFHANAWDGSTDEWISSQADPNYCDLDCKPNILRDTVSLGAISTDGIIYTPIKGSVVCKSMIDSVQNFDDGGWDWSNFGSPFDNDSTMGLAVNARAIGVLSAPPAAVLLNNMTLDIWDVKERNGNAVPNWKIGAYNDNDMRALPAGGAFDTTLFDQAHSVGWSSSIIGGSAAGFVKIPFGCGYSPMKNVVAAVADYWVYLPDWDTAYYYMSRGDSAFDQGVRTSPQDEGSWYTFAEHDFTPSETYSFGYAFFAFTGMTNSFSSTADGKIANTAILVNKWAGFDRGDINDDGVINLADIIRLAENVNYGRPGPIPFKHLGDVDASGGNPNFADVQYLVDYYFNYGPCPKGAWVL